VIGYLTTQRETARRIAAVFGRAVTATGNFVAPRLRFSFRRRWVRRFTITFATLAIVIGVTCAGVAWRLSQGPISLDYFTPMLASAIQQNFGTEQRIEVGGTTVERDRNGATSLRLVDVLLRDRDGAVVASASKVEVGISLASLLTGQVHASRLRFVGAEVAVRIDANGKIAVFAGGNSRPIAVADPKAQALPQPAPGGGAQSTPGPRVPQLIENGVEDFAALLAWVDGLGRSGLDGYELSELGLVDGTLVVDDLREGRHWTFDNIDVSLNRPKHGGVEFIMRSEEPGRPWAIRAAAAPSGSENRAIQIEARRVPAKDLLLALRFADLPISADLPLSARLHCEIGPDGMPQMLRGAIVAETGVVGLKGVGPRSIAVERATLSLEWNAAQRTLLVPMQIAAGGNRFTVVAQLDVPSDQNTPWKWRLGGGSIMLANGDDPPLVLNRILAHGQIDFAQRRVDLLQAEFGNGDTAVALSGGIDYSDRPRLMLGLAARPMSLSTLKALWPGELMPIVRKWAIDHIRAARVERVDVAVNAPLAALDTQGPPMPDDGLSLSIVSSAMILRPVNSLPEIRDGNLEVTVRGRSVRIKLARGTVVLPSGRKLTVADGEMRIPDAHVRPSPSRTRFRLDGPVAAVAELLAMDRLRESSGGLLDPATSRGAVSAEVALGLQMSQHMDDSTATYQVEADFNNFAAERMIMGQRVEAANLHLHADNDGYQVKGDVKIAGAPATMDYRKRRKDADAEVRLHSVLDEAARARLGINVGPGLNGPVPIKLSGQLGATGKDARFAIEADLTHATVDELLPGWVKPPSKPARATFTLVSKAASTRLEDLTVDGSGTLVRGSVELDAAGNLLSANFPVFSPTALDKVALKAERGNDGTLHVTLRGDVYDGRKFLKSMLAGPAPDSVTAPKLDIDLDVKLGIIVGHHGETLRSTDLKLSRRNGTIRKFTLNAKLGAGRDASLSGELDRRGSGRQGIHLETDDAGALFRFADVYPRMSGGQMSVSMDAPTAEQGPQNGTLVVEDFSVRGEAALNRVVVGMGSTQQSNVDFSAMHVNFVRKPGSVSIHDGVVRGPVIGATIDGTIDYRRDDVRMRGTFVPLFGLNNMFGRLPIVGMLLGGSNEGLVGITYEVVGSPSAPILRVNPVSAVAPGFIRKFFEFRGDGGSRPLRPPGTVQSTR
jgi:hypothetical protein